MLRIIGRSDHEGRVTSTFDGLYLGIKLITQNIKVVKLCMSEVISTGNRPFDEECCDNQKSPLPISLYYTRLINAGKCSVDLGPESTHVNPE